MELPDVGKHWEFDDCKRNDHISFRDHKCTPTQEPDQAGTAHIDHNCKSDQTMKKRADTCSQRGCKQCENAIQVKCAECLKSFCIEHRVSDVPNCIDSDGFGRTHSRAAAAALSRIQSATEAAVSANATIPKNDCTKIPENKSNNVAASSTDDDLALAIKMSLQETCCSGETKATEANNLISEPWSDVFKKERENIRAVQQEIETLNQKNREMWKDLFAAQAKAHEQFIQQSLVTDIRRNAARQIKQEKADEDKNLEELSLVWYGADANSTEENKQTQLKLRETINYLKTFETDQECLNYIRRRRKEKIILVVSDGLGQEIIPYVHHLHQIIAIYVYCPVKEELKGSLSDYRKIKAVVTTLADLIKAVSNNQTKLERFKTMPLALANPWNDTHMDILFEQKKFLWYQLIIEAIMRMKDKDSETGFHELIKVCKRQYSENWINHKDVADLDNYESSQAIYWYTRDSFVYRVLNRALRGRDIDTLVLFAFLIRDIYKQLKEEKNFEEEVIHVFRGQLMSVKEVERLQKKEKGTVSLNTFLSTTSNRQLAVVLAGAENADPTITSVLFEIEANTKATGTKPFADITHLSNFGEAEGEVLFMLHTVFKVVEISWNAKEKLWIIKLVLDVDEENISCYISSRKQRNLEVETSYISLGYIFLDMKKYDEAEKYFNKMLYSLSEDNPKIAECNIGLQKVAIGRANDPPTTPSEIIETYMKRGNICLKKQDYNEAVENYSKALDAKLKDDGPNNYETADIFTAIGHVYIALKHYDLALQYYQEAFDIQAGLVKECEPEYVSILKRYSENNENDTSADCSHSLQAFFQNYTKPAQSLNNIGKTHYYKNEYGEAMKTYNRALTIQLQFHADGPQIETAQTYINIAELYEDGHHNYTDALTNYEKAFEVYQNSSAPISSQEVVKIQNDIMRVKQELLNPSPSPPSSKRKNENEIEENMRPVHNEANINVDFEFLRSHILKFKKNKYKEKNLEEFCLLWCDVDVNATEENRQTQLKLRQAINYLKACETVEECTQYIQQYTDEKIVLIVSGQFGAELVSEVHSLKQLIAIYVYCRNSDENELWTNVYDANVYEKVKGVATSTTSLTAQISTDQKKRNQSEEEKVPISIFDSRTTSLVYSTDQSPGYDFVWIQTMIGYSILLNNFRTPVQFHEFLEMCKQQYAGNQSELKVINKLEGRYSATDALKWDIQGTFMHKILTKAFKNHDAELLEKFRFLIQDYYTQLKQRQKFDDLTIHVYRGQLMSIAELERLKTNEKRFISINTFLSTFLNREEALKFLSSNSGSQQDNTKTSVLFEIEANTQLQGTKPFADISQIRDLEGSKKQVLFMIGSVLQIMHISRNEEENLWMIKLNLIEENTTELKPVYETIKTDIDHVLSVGQAIWRGETHTETEQYLQWRLNVLPTNDPAVLHCYNELAKVIYERGDYDTAQFYYRKALQLALRDPLVDPNVMAESYTNLAVLLRETHEYDEALECLYKALDVRLKTFGHDHLLTANIYYRIASLHIIQKKFDLALRCLNECLEIQTKLLPEYHPDRALTIITIVNLDSVEIGL